MIDPPLAENCEKTTPTLPSNTSSDLTDILPSWCPISLDSDVLRSLHDWDRNHPDHRIPSVLDRIATAMESFAFKTALDLIPNAPFPAGTVVKALAAVVALGLVWENLWRMLLRLMDSS
jgi:hypothetical protein